MKKRFWGWILFVGVFLGFGWGGPQGSYGADKVLRAIYYQSGEALYRMKPDGSGEVLVVGDVGKYVDQIFVHSQSNRIYWSSGGTIRRASLTGGNPEVVLVTTARLGRFGFDPRDHKLFYFAEQNNSDILELVGRDLDSGEEQVILRGDRRRVGGMPMVDPVGRMVYFGIDGNSFGRVSIDDVDQEVSQIELLGPGHGPIDVGGLFVSGAIDAEDRWIYLFPVRVTEVYVINRTHLESLATESSAFANQGFWGAPMWMGDFLPQDGSDTIYFLNRGDELPYGLYRASFSGGEPVLVREGVGKFSLDLVDGESRDVESPVVSLLSPSSGTTSQGTVTLAGVATDNNLVAMVRWSLNGIDQGLLAVNPQDGSFGVNQVPLEVGENVIEVAAEDLDGNETATEVTVSWQPQRSLSLGEERGIAEGDVVRIPLHLDTPGDAGGLTLEVRYDPVYLRALAFEDDLSGSIVTTNLTTPGLVVITLAHGGGTLPAGELLLGELLFRGRSVPQDIAVPLSGSIRDVSSAEGEPLPSGNSGDDTVIFIRPREIIGDINTNRLLDIGDALLMQRLLSGLDEVRDWDHLLNDLNGSEALDSGDVVMVLRTVLGILPQPEVGGQKQARGREVAETEGPRARIVLSEPDPQAGETITVEVHLENLKENLNGVSFALEYPRDALELQGENARGAGSLIAGGSFVLWNDSQTVGSDGAVTGSVGFVASHSSPWPGSSEGGQIAVLRFMVKAGIADRAVWPLTLKNVHVPVDGGYAIERAMEVREWLVGQPLSFEEWLAQRYSAEELEDPSVAGWSADPDGSGRSNGQKYLQGPEGEGIQGGVSGATWRTAAGREIPVVVFPRRLDAVEGSVELEMSQDLKEWEPTASAVYHRQPTGEPGEEQWHVGPQTPPATWQQFFLRLVYRSAGPG